MKESLSSGHSIYQPHKGAIRFTTLEMRRFDKVFNKVTPGSDVQIPCERLRDLEKHTHLMGPQWA